MTTVAGSVTWAARAVEKVPPWAMLETGAGTADRTTGKSMVPSGAGRVQV